MNSSNRIFRPPGYGSAEWSLFYCWCLFSYFQCKIYKLLWNLPHDRNWVQFYNLGSQIWVHPPKKFGAKNFQNYMWFWTTLDFDREYIWNRLKYRKSDNVVIKHDPSHIRRMKFGELWSTNYKSGEVDSDPPKVNFEVATKNVWKGNYVCPGEGWGLWIVWFTELIAMFCFRCKVRWNSDVRESDSKLSVEVEGEIFPQCHKFCR